MSKDIQLPQVDEKTETYLLTNKGMEKLDVNKDIHKEEKADSVKKSKKDSPSGRADGNRDLRENALKGPGNEEGKRDRRPSWRSHNPSAGESGMDVNRVLTQKGEAGDIGQPNALVEILNMAILNVLESKEQENEEEQQAIVHDRERLGGIDFGNDALAYQYFAERIGELSPWTIDPIFTTIEEEIDKISSILFRYVGNDMWKFIYFIMVCLENLDVNHPSFITVRQTLDAYCEKLLEKEKGKFTSFFRDLFLPNYVDAVKTALTYEKREALVKILYSFFPKDGLSRSEAIRQYRAKLDDLGIFIQSLAILCSLETAESESFKELKADFKLYAKLAVKDKKVYIRLNGLLLMDRMIDLDYEWVQKIMVRYLDCVSPNDWWENKIMIVVVYTKLLQRLSQTELYQRHIKMKNSEMVKVVTVENEMMIKVVKDMLEQISLALARVLSKNLNQDLARVAMIHLADVMSESRILVGIFIDLLLQASPELREWVLYSGEDFEDQEVKERFIIQNEWSLSYRCTLNNENLKKSAGDLLTEMANKVKSIDSPEKLGPAHLDILVFCLSSKFDLQKLNVEVTDTLINSSLDPIFFRMLDPDNCDSAAQVLERYVENFLREEVSIQEFEKRFAEMLLRAFNYQGPEVVRLNIRLFVENLGKEYVSGNALYEKFTKLCSRVTLIVNRKTLHNTEDAELAEKVFGTEFGEEVPANEE